MSKYPKCKMNPNCPLCEKPLEPVRRSPNSPLNSEQFDAVKAGDWFCECSDNGRGNDPYAYFLDREVALAEVIPESGGHLESADCWCDPTVEEHPGGTLIIHNQTH